MARSVVKRARRAFKSAARVLLPLFPAEVTNRPLESLIRKGPTLQAGWITSRVLQIPAFAACRVHRRLQSAIWARDKMPVSLKVSPRTATGSLRRNRNGLSRGSTASRHDSEFSHCRHFDSAENWASWSGLLATARKNCPLEEKLPPLSCLFGRRIFFFFF